MTSLHWSTKALTKARSYLRARAIWAAVFVVTGLVLRVVRPPPPPRTAEGVAAMLGAAVGGEVRSDDFVWEARGGFWSDAFLGRSVLFLARSPGAAAADLYRARVRLTRSGQPLGVGVVRNLARSPLGDDRDLVATGHRAAYVTWAFGAAQGITLLDLAGDGQEGRGGLQGLAGAVWRWLETGSSRGIGRTEVVFASPPGEAREELQGDVLVMALGKEALPAALDPEDGSLDTGPSNPFGAAAQRVPHRTPPLDTVAVEAAREGLGATAAGVLRTSLDALAAAERRIHPPPRPPPALPMRGDAEPLLLPPGEDGWPLPPITPPVQPALAGEGVWVAGFAGAPRSEAANAPPPPVIETAIRPDPGRPEAVVRLWALDTRQVDLQLVAGVDEPRSALGLHGPGRLPEGTPADRVVASFAAGPASPEPRVEPGFVVDRRVLVPPSPGLATLAIAGDGRVQMGAWGGTREVPEGFTSIRQTPDAILGWADAARRPLEGAGAEIERSALGLTRGGQLVYAWAARAPAATLARALELAGCTFAVPLAAAPARVGLVVPAEPPPGPSPNDVIYAVRRGAGPPPLASGSFAPDGGKQPAPSWLPAIHAAVVTSLGAQVHLTAFAPGRLAFHIRPGTREPSTKGVASLATALPEGDAARVVAAIGLGSGRRKGARGLVVEGIAGLPVRSEDAGALVVERGRPKIARASEMAGVGGDATELPLTADEGKLRPEARDVGPMRARAAACALDDGTLVVASTNFDSDEAATAALLDLGCARVVALDRGSHQAAFLHRAGTPGGPGGGAPEARYEASALYAVEVPLPGRAGPLSR